MKKNVQFTYVLPTLQDRLRQKGKAGRKKKTTSSLGISHVIEERISNIHEKVNTLSYDAWKIM